MAEPDQVAKKKCHNLIVDCDYSLPFGEYRILCGWCDTQGITSYNLELIIFSIQGAD